jgi:2-polyprenyl-3-methyl-5-hydroxy-6-metoxy-1,4-benzoquinol methylase
MDVLIKEQAVGYFHRQSGQYAERYSVLARGDMLWDRHHAILGLLRAADLPAGSSIIDLGCGPGLLSLDLARLGYRGTGLDGAPAMVEHSRSQAEAAGVAALWQYRVGDVEDVPLPARSFDAAISAGVIEYLPDDYGLVREAARLLKPGGRFILCVTNQYGYTVSLYPVLHWLKKIPGMVSLASAIRRLLVGGKGGAMDFGFLPRKQRPAEIRKILRQHGFEIQHDRYLQFTLVPAPFCALLSRLRLGFEADLNALDRTPLRIFGSCYILSCRKAG